MKKQLFFICILSLLVFIPTSNYAQSVSVENIPDIKLKQRVKIDPLISGEKDAKMPLRQQKAELLEQEKKNADNEKKLSGIKSKIAKVDANIKKQEEKTNKKMQSILTEEQYRFFLENRAAIINENTRFGPRGAGGPPGGGRPGGGGGRGGFGMRLGSNEIYDPRAKRKVSIAAHETKKFVSVWDDAPRSIVVNTIVSANLPSVITLPVSNIIRERNKLIDEEGDFIVSNALLNIPGEVIVDNEDYELFSLSKPDIVGLLPQWLEGVSDNSFRYSGVTA